MISGCWQKVSLSLSLALSLSLSHAPIPPTVHDAFMNSTMPNGIGSRLDTSVSKPAPSTCSLTDSPSGCLVVERHGSTDRATCVRATNYFRTTQGKGSPDSGQLVCACGACLNYRPSTLMLVWAHHLSSWQRSQDGSRCFSSGAFSDRWIVLYTDAASLRKAGSLAICNNYT